MKENNEVVQGDNTARGSSASGADLSVGAVLSAEKDTKKLNAGIALVCLGSYLDDGKITQEQFKRISCLAERCMNTSLMIESEVNDAEYIEQAIAYIEDYLKEQGV
jgi:hypothetical protein